MRIFLDTNVIVSAFATRGLCADLLRVVLAEHELVLGVTVLEEVDRVLQEKFRMPAPDVAEIAAFLRRQAEIVTATSRRIAGLDAADARVVAEASAGAAAVLVTGDKGLLELPDSPVRIVAPRELWELLRRAT